MVRLLALSTGRLYSQEMFLVFISLRGWIDPQGHSAIGRIMSMKNSNYTSWDRTSDLPICSTATYPLCYRRPHTTLINTWKPIFKKRDGVTWTGLNWLGIETRGGLLWRKQLTAGLHKMTGIFLLADGLLVSQEGLCSLELFSQLVMYTANTLTEKCRKLIVQN